MSFDDDRAAGWPAGDVPVTSLSFVGHSMGGPVVVEAARLLGQRVMAVLSPNRGAIIYMFHTLVPGLIGL